MADDSFMAVTLGKLCFGTFDVVNLQRNNVKVKSVNIQVNMNKS